MILSDLPRTPARTATAPAFVRFSVDTVHLGSHDAFFQKPGEQCAIPGDLTGKLIM